MRKGGRGGGEGPGEVEESLYKYTSTTSGSQTDNGTSTFYIYCNCRRRHRHRRHPASTAFLDLNSTILHEFTRHPKPEHNTYPLKEAARRQKETLQETVDEVEVRLAQMSSVRTEYESISFTRLFLSFFFFFLPLSFFFLKKKRARFPMTCMHYASM